MKYYPVLRRSVSWSNTAFFPVFLREDDNKQHSYKSSLWEKPAGGFGRNSNLLHSCSHTRCFALPERCELRENEVGSHLLRVGDHGYTQLMMSFSFLASNPVQTFSTYDRKEGRWPVRVYACWKSQIDNIYYVTSNVYSYAWQLRREYTVVFHDDSNPDYVKHFELSGRVSPIFREMNAAVPVEPDFDQATLERIKKFANTCREKPAQDRYYEIRDNEDMALRHPSFCWPLSFKDIGELPLGQLAAEAYEGVNFFTGNGLMYLRDLTATPASVRRFVSTLKSVPDAKIKALASLYLSIHYGFKLTVLDSMDIHEQIDRFQRMNKHTKCFAQSSEVLAGNINANYTLNVYYDVYGELLSNVSSYLNLLDMVPTMHGVWDMIPFSFVVDWFVNIGELAEGIDNFVNVTQKHKVIGSVSTKKLRKTFTVLQNGVVYINDNVLFVRRSTPNWCPVPSFSLKVEPSKALSHSVEAGSLIVSLK